MFYILFSVLFLVMAVLSVLSGMHKGKKYIWSYSVARLVVAIVSAVVAALLSAKVSFVFFRMAFTVIKGGTGNLAKLLSSVSLMTDALSALASMLVAPILFYIVFWLLRQLLGFVTKIILRSIAKSHAKKKGTLLSEEKTAELTEEASIVNTKKRKKDQKKKKRKDDGYFRIRDKKNPLGKLCGAVCGLVVFLLTMIPAVGMLGIADDMTAWGLAGSTDPILQNIVEFVDAGANNAGAKVVRVVGGEAVYSLMTTYEVDGEKATLAKETNLLGTVGRALSDMTNKEIPRTEAAASVQKIDEAFEETTLISAVLPDFLNQAKASWDQGEDYCGVKKPSFGKMDGLVHPILNVFGNSTDETIYEDMSTLVDSMAYMVEKDALTNIKEDPMSMFEKKDVTEKVMGDLLKNDHLAPLVGDFAKFGIDLFGDAMGASMENVVANSSQIANPDQEAKQLSEALAEMTAVNKTVKQGGFKDASAIVVLGPMMDALAKTETVGKENTDRMMIQLMTSSRLMSLTKMNAEKSLEVATEINDGASIVGYTVMLERFALELSYRRD